MALKDNEKKLIGDAAKLIAAIVKQIPNVDVDEAVEEFEEALHTELEAEKEIPGPLHAVALGCNVLNDAAVVTGDEKFIKAAALVKAVADKLDTNGGHPFLALIGGLIHHKKLVQADNEAVNTAETTAAEPTGDAPTPPQAQ